MIALEHGLDSRVQNIFNLLANIVASHEKQKANSKRNNKLIVSLTKTDSDINRNLSDNLSLKCWLCKIIKGWWTASVLRIEVSVKEDSL